jgi:hypothetical protein
VTLWTDGAQLHFSAPKGALGAEDLCDLRTQKRGVIDLLQELELQGGISAGARLPDGPFDLTALQMRKWKYAHDMNAGLGLRTCIVAHRISGHLSTDVLKAALEVLVRRHDALRMRFAVFDGTPKQWVDPQLQHPLQLVDLSSLSGDAAGTALMQGCTLAVSEQMRLCADPMVSVRLFRSSPTDHVVLVAMNHMVSDAVSCDLIAQELWALYYRILQGQPPELPNVAQFSGYVAWQHRTGGAWLRKHGPFWQERLAGISPSRFAVHDGDEPPMTQSRSVIFDEGLTSRLRSIAQRERSLPALVVLTVCIGALSRWLRQRDLIMTCVSNCRDHPELQRMVGFLADYLHLRVQVNDGDTFIALLERVGRQFRSAYEHQDYGRVPDLIPASKADIVFNWVPRTSPSEFARAPAGSGPALDIQPLRIPLTVPMEPPMKLAPAFHETSTNIAGALFYRPDVFSPLAMEDLAGELIGVAEHACGDPEARLW